MNMEQRMAQLEAQVKAHLQDCANLRNLLIYRLNRMEGIMYSAAGAIILVLVGLLFKVHI